MKSNGMNALSLVFAASIALSIPAAATDTGTDPSKEKGTLQLSLGQRDFMTYCASCHGETAVGDGTVAEYLAVKAADLTKLARKYGGKFPEERVAQIIDGRQTLRVHGTSAMPIWGDWFNYEA